MTYRTHSMLMATALALAIVFSIFPGIDPRVSGLFYDANRKFYWASVPVVRLIHDGVPLFSALMGVILVIALALGLRRGQSMPGLSWKAAAYLLAVLIIGPGILVNTVLKDHWGRARPVQTQEFGGNKSFTPALLPSNQCDRNCSFVCGHSSAGFYVMSFAFILRTRRAKRFAFWGGLGFGGLIGLIRIAEGGHYLSDVMFSGLLVYAVAWGMAKLMLPKAENDEPILMKT